MVITNGFTYVAFLMFLGGGLLALQKYAKWKIFNLIPPLVWVYVLNMVFCTIGLYNSEGVAATYSALKNNLLYALSLIHISSVFCLRLPDQITDAHQHIAIFIQLIQHLIQFKNSDRVFIHCRNPGRVLFAERIFRIHAHASDINMRDLDVYKRQVFNIISSKRDRILYLLRNSEPSII